MHAAAASLPLSAVLLAALLFGAGSGLASTIGAALEPLRTAAQDNNALKYDLGNRQKPGICIEVIRAIEQLDPELRFTGWDQPQSLRRIEAMLAEGQLDAFCALLKSAPREQKYLFIDVPVYTVRHRVAVRADDAVVAENFDDMRRLGAEGTVLVLRSTAHEDHLKKQDGLLLDASSPDLAINLKKLVARRGRFLYHTENALLRYIALEGLEGKVRLLPTVFKEESLYFMLSRAVQASVVARLRAALEKLAKRGELERIYASYREKEN